MAKIGNAEMLRIVDAIARERNVEKETLFVDIEQAMVSAARKHFDAEEEEDFQCEIDRFTGQIRMWHNQEEIPLERLGRIPAQTAKQVMIQKFREDERESIYQEYIDRIGEITTGTAQRYEGGSLVVQIGRAEGFMPRSEQIPGEQHSPGERVRCLILDVRDTGSQVKIVLSRGNPEFIRRLFEVEVPEVSERVIEIKALAREPGHRTKVAVSSIDSKVDAVGACVGVRGSRIKNIVDELGGEKIDIVRWNESSQVLIANALRPAEVVETSLCFELSRATVVVNEDQLSLAIGKRGQNVRLAARLTGWDVDILTPPEFSKGLDTLEQVLMAIEGFTEEMVDRLAALGFISVFDIEEVGADVLQGHLIDFDMSLDLAETAVNRCSEKAKEVAEEMERQKAIEAQRKADEAAGLISGDSADAQAAAILGSEGGGTGDESAPGEGEPARTPADDGSGNIMDMLMSRRAAASAPAQPQGTGEPPAVSDETTEGESLAPGAAPPPTAASPAASVPTEATPDEDTSRDAAAASEQTTDTEASASRQAASEPEEDTDLQRIARNEATGFEQPAEPAEQAAEREPDADRTQ